MQNDATSQVIRLGLATWLALALLATHARAGEPGLAGGVPAQEGASARDEADEPIPTAAPAPKSVSPLPVYKLPPVGKPRRRVGGGRRGGEGLAPGVTALVPEHVGLTAMAQPSLYWRLEGAAQPGARFEV